MEQLAYTLSEFAVAAKVCKSRIYQDIAAGKLSAKKNGRRTLILQSEAARYLAALPDFSPSKAGSAA